MLGIVEGRTTALFMIILMGIFIYWTLRRTSSTGKIPWMRRIAAIDAMEEAVGRAVETGKPVVCGYGRARSFEASTLAGLSTLEYVAKLAASKGAKLIVPLAGSDQGTGGPVTIPIAREIVHNAFSSYTPELEEQNVELRYMGDIGFCVMSATVALLQNERPAAHIFIGQYMAECITLGEVTNTVGAIGIAGASGVGGNVATLAVTCDYVVIGEEVPALGAYFSNDPAMRGSIYAQDIIKLVMAGVIVLGVIGAQFGFNLLSFLTI